MLATSAKCWFGMFRAMKQQPKSCYDLLGVQRDANQSEIKLAYFELVKKVHPDQNKAPDAEEQFKEIVKAYETLKDPIKRQIYDLDQGGVRGYDVNQSGQGFSAGGSGSDEAYYNKKGNKNYWENRWYGYHRPAYETQHEEQQQFSEMYYQFNKKTFYSVLRKLAVIIGIYLSIDLYRMYAKRRHDQFLHTQKEIIHGQLRPNNPDLERYIEERQEAWENDDQ